MAGHALSVQTSHKSDEHYTPLHIVDLLVDFFDTIDLDPSSNSHKDPNIPAIQQFTSWDEGLTKTWGPTPKTVWINPPYSQNLKWSGKVVSEWNEGHIKEIIILLPVRLGTKWFINYSALDPIVLPIKGRLKFGGSSSAAPFESMLLYIGNRRGEFVRVFKPVSSCILWCNGLNLPSQGGLNGSII